MSTRQEQARDNRLLMPECSRVIDSFRQVFGEENVKVTFAAENNIRLGRPGSGEAPMSAPPADMTLQQSELEIERKLARS